MRPPAPGSRDQPGSGLTTTARRGSRATESVDSGLGSPVAGQATTRRLPACTPLPRTKNANRCAAAAGLAPVQLGGVRPRIAVRAGCSVPMVTNVDAQVADVVEDGPHVDKSVLRGGSSVTSWCPRSKDEDRLSAARLFPQPTPSSQRVAGAGQGGRADHLVVAVDDHHVVQGAFPPGIRFAPVRQREPRRKLEASGAAVRGRTRPEPTSPSDQS